MFVDHSLISVSPLLRIPLFVVRGWGQGGKVPLEKIVTDESKRDKDNETLFGKSAQITKGHRIYSNRCASRTLPKSTYTK